MRGRAWHTDMDVKFPTLKFTSDLTERENDGRTIVLGGFEHGIDVFFRERGDDEQGRRWEFDEITRDVKGVERKIQGSVCVVGLRNVSC